MVIWKLKHKPVKYLKHTWSNRSAGQYTLYVGDEFKLEFLYYDFGQVVLKLQNKSTKDTPKAPE